MSYHDICSDDYLIIPRNSLYPYLAELVAEATRAPFTNVD